jgi:hypothetical protein
MTQKHLSVHADGQVGVKMARVEQRFDHRDDRGFPRTIVDFRPLCPAEERKCGHLPQQDSPQHQRNDQTDDPAEEGNRNLCTKPVADKLRQRIENARNLEHLF